MLYLACDIGEEFLNARCKPCQFGWYSNVFSRDPCTQCALYENTTDIGSTGEVECCTYHQMLFGIILKCPLLLSVCLILQYKERFEIRNYAKKHDCSGKSRISRSRVANPRRGHQLNIFARIKTNP